MSSGRKMGWEEGLALILPIALAHLQCGHWEGCSPLGLLLWTEVRVQGMPMYFRGPKFSVLWIPL